MRFWVAWRFAVLIALAPSAARAWGTLGHRVVAEIAQQHLSPEARAAVTKALGGHTLADVANWADELRDDHRYDKFKVLHFATVLDGTAHYVESKKEPCGDIVVAIHVLTDFLRSGKRDGLATIKAFTETIDHTCNPILTDPLDEPHALAFLVHFVGDIHQPLHVSGTDRGGNTVK